MRILLILLLAFSPRSFLSQINCTPLATYFGQIQHDDLKGICKDHEGSTYAIGNTYNNNLPTTPGIFQSAYKNDYECYIVKFDSCSNFVWCSYFGSSSFDSGEKIVYSKTDSTVIITGYTNGSDIATTPSAFQTTLNGNYDCFLAKFSLNGQAKWVTYFGGSNSDFAYALTTDTDGNIAIAGTSISSSIHTSSSSFQQFNAGATDAFIAKFSQQGNFLFSTFYGGLNAEDIHAVTTDDDKNIIAVGGSFSNNLNTSAGCLQSSSNGGMEIYTVKFDALGNRIFSTYIGGTGTDDAYGVCTDSNKNIYLTGHTSSNDFYFSSVSHQNSIAGNNDNFCMKLSPAGSLMWSNVFGGSSFDSNVSCKLNGNNEVISLINTQSADFPVLGPGTNTVYAGSGDLLIVRIGSQGQLLWSGFTGGTGGETGGDLYLKHNLAVIAGGTSSPDLPVLTGNYQLINNGQSDGFILTADLPGSSITGIKENSGCKILIEENNLVNKSNCVVTHIQVNDILGKEILFSETENIKLGELEKNQLYILTLYNGKEITGTIKYLTGY